ncbi:flagellar biosynthetic protein FliR [Paenibacillus physcomitrellae]|uniref:Flagellar biosynthetic protein FliR n=1 Tax=Paenibacillus physcomitrellae TaxID=1619311 RepID=A0ABQ1GA05_9BACL|nr:flagellar biosynthetic protein FliR [Paenibacillus physcomitrellae]GGA39615.1 flagellar biosynthetic protein FliR [Paenibacillus physcomitrellae]
MDIMQALPVFMLIFCRITAFFVVAPVFSARTVPNTFKVGFSGILAVLIFLVYGTKQTVPTDLTFILFILREILIGLLMGYVATLIFTVITMAGAFLDIQIGFGIANVLDPMTGASAPVTGNFKYAIATLFFLGMNGHHYLIQAMLRSYDWIPLSNDVFARTANGNINEFLIHAFSQSFMLAFQLAAPIIVALFLTDVALGFLAKTAPQFNIFVIGVPLKILVGLVLLLVFMSSLVYSFQQLFETLFKTLENLMGTMGSRP